MSPWQKYRRRPLVVKARKLKRDMYFKTPEGEICGRKGDWHVIGIVGESYPMKNEIFMASMDLVEEDGVSEA